MDENYISLERAIERMYEVTEECGTERIFIDRIIDELENLPSSPNICIHPQWIPVSERLPDEYQRVLALLAESKLQVVARIIDGKWVVTWNNDRCPKITHWMPLPDHRRRIND